MTRFDTRPNASTSTSTSTGTGTGTGARSDRFARVRPRTPVGVCGPERALRASWRVGLRALRSARPDLVPTDARGTSAHLTITIEASGAADGADASFTAIARLTFEGGRDGARDRAGDLVGDRADDAGIECARHPARVRPVRGGHHVDAGPLLSALFNTRSEARYARTNVFDTLGIAGGRYELARITPR